MAARHEPLTDAIGEELAEWGKVALIETFGRVSGSPVVAAVGFTEDAGGVLLVAAGSETSDWALNLRARPRCRVTIGDRTGIYEATIATDDEHARTVTALILKYGTPAEKLGRGPAFKLSPV